MTGELKLWHNDSGDIRGIALYYIIKTLLTEIVEYLKIFEVNAKRFEK